MFNKKGTRVVKLKREQKGKRLFMFTYSDIAMASGVTEEKVRQDVCRGILKIDSLEELSAYCICGDMASTMRYVINLKTKKISIKQLLQGLMGEWLLETYYRRKIINAIPVELEPPETDQERGERD